MLYYELPKLPASVGKDDKLGLWLKLFSAKTEEDMQQIKAMEVPVMDKAIDTYRSITASQEFRELERMREISRYIEADSLYHAEKRGKELADAKWQAVVADKDAQIARLMAQLDQGADS